MALSICSTYKHVGEATFGPLDLFLLDLDERNGKISCSQEVRLIQSRVRKVIRSILMEVRRENPFFRTTLINSGSFYEGTKVGQPDEFDYLIQLDGFSTPEDILFEELPCSTLAVVPSESAIENLKFYFPDDMDLFFGDFEWKKSIKAPFFKIFNEKAEGFEAYGMKVVLPNENVPTLPDLPPLARHGPAYTLLLEWNGGEQYKGLRISVDLALAVKINSRPNMVDLEFESPTGRVIKSLFDCIPCYFAVGSYRDVLAEVHPSYFAEYTNTSSSLRPSNFCLRCSQSCFEQALFCQEFGPDSGQSKCLRLLKVLRDIMFPDVETEFKRHNSGYWSFIADTAAMDLKDTAGKLVSSYVLKTLVLFEWQQNPADELWFGNKLSQRLLSILRSLVAHLKQGKLRSFFYADYDIFPSSITRQMESCYDALNTIFILQENLLFIGNMNEYNFEECMKKIKDDSAVVCRKKSFTSLLLTGFWETLSGDPYLRKAVKVSQRKENIEEISSEESKNGELFPEALDFTIEGEHTFYAIYIQALLDEIAPEETLILTSTKVKQAKSLSQAGQLFKKIAQRRMAESLNILPSYNLWSQELWRLEGSVYEYKTDEPKKLMKFLFDQFQKDIKILLHELNIDLS